MQNPEVPRLRVPLLEILLCLSVITLTVQIFPTLATALLAAIDFRHWSRFAWISFNGLLILGLCVAHVLPDTVLAWRTWRERVRLERAKAKKALEMKQHREMLQRLAAGRKRRVY